MTMLYLGVCYCCVVAVKVSENHKTKMRHHSSRPNMQLQMLYRLLMLNLFGLPVHVTVRVPPLFLVWNSNSRISQNYRACCFLMLNVSFYL